MCIRDSYNGSLVQSTGSFSVGRGGLTGGSAGNYALFAGGYIHYTDESKDDVYYNTVDAFNSSLTRSAATGLSVARSETFAVNTGARLLFAGGVKNNGATYLSTVDTYDSSLTRMTAASLPKALANEDMAGVPLDGKALIEASDRMLVYDESMTLTILETFDSTYGTRYEAAAAVVGSYGLFAGGYGNMGGLSSNTRLNLVRAYTI